jgi:hypothetical protein
MSSTSSLDTQTEQTEQQQQISTFVFNKIRNSTATKLFMKINHSIQCVLETRHASLAMLYFIDENGDKINIPDGLCVYTYDYENCNLRIAYAKAPKTQMFILCFTDNYDIVFMNQLLHKIEAQRSWKITHPILNTGF